MKHFYLSKSSSRMGLFRSINIIITTAIKNTESTKDKVDIM